MVSRIIIILTVISFFTSLHALEKKLKLAIMDATDSTAKIDQKLLETVSEILRTQFSTSGAFLVIDKSRQQAKLHEMIRAEQKESYKECYDNSCQIPLGHALSADTILRTNFSCFNETCILSSELVDLAKEATVGGANAKFSYNDKDLTANIITGIESILAQIISKMEKEEKIVFEKKQQLETKEKELAEKKEREEQEKFKQSQQKQPEKMTIRPYFWYGITSEIAGIAMLGSAFYFNTKVADYNEKAEKTSNQKEAESYFSDGKTSKTLRTVSFISAGVFCAGGLALLLITEEKELPISISFDQSGFFASYTIKF